MDDGKSSNASLDLGTPVHIEDKQWTPARPKNMNPMMTPNNQVMRPYKVANEGRPPMQPLADNLWTGKSSAKGWSLTPVARIPAANTKGSQGKYGSLLKSSLCAKAVNRKAKGGLGLATALSSQTHGRLPPPTRNTATSSNVPSLTLSPSVIGITPLDSKKHKPKPKAFLPSAWSSCFDMHSLREPVDTGIYGESFKKDDPISVEDNTSQRLNMDDSDIELSDSGNLLKSTSTTTKQSRFRKKSSKKSSASSNLEIEFDSRQSTELLRKSSKRYCDSESDDETVSSNLLKRKKIISPISSSEIQSIIDYDINDDTTNDKSIMSGISPVKITPPKRQSALGFSLISTPPDLAKASKFMRFNSNIKPNGRINNNVVQSDAATVSSIVGMESSEGNSPVGMPSSVFLSNNRNTNITSTSTDLFKKADRICKEVDVSVCSHDGEDLTAVSTNLINMNQPTYSPATTGEVNQYFEDLTSTGFEETNTTRTKLEQTTVPSDSVMSACSDYGHEDHSVSVAVDIPRSTTAYTNTAMSDINEMCHEVETAGLQSGVGDYDHIVDPIDSYSAAGKTEISIQKSSIKSSLKKRSKSKQSNPWKGGVPQTPSEYSYNGMYAPPPPSSVSSFRTSKITGGDVFATPGAVSTKSCSSDVIQDPAVIARMGWTPLKNGPIEGPTGFPCPQFSSPLEEQQWKDQASEWIQNFNSYIDDCDNVEL